MNRMPHKRYQRLCAQYNRAIQRAIRLEILIDELVDANLTDGERSVRRTRTVAEDGIALHAFRLPLVAEVDRWRKEPCT